VNGVYTSTWEPTITVRSRGVLKYSAASTVMAEVARKRLGHGLRGAAAQLDRGDEVRGRVHLDRALDVGGFEHLQHLGHVRRVHVAESGADVG
jgi:hypothetical protein